MGSRGGATGCVTSREARPDILLPIDAHTPPTQAPALNTESPPRHVRGTRHTCTQLLLLKQPGARGRMLRTSFKDAGATDKSKSRIRQVPVIVLTVPRRFNMYCKTDKIGRSYQCNMREPWSDFYFLCTRCFCVRQSGLCDYLSLRDLTFSQ